MIKNLPHAPDATALAERLAGLAADHSALLIGPIIRDGAAYGRTMVFTVPDARKVISAAFVGLGTAPPSVLAEFILFRALRERFAEVRVFETGDTLADAAAKLWPCARSAELCVDGDGLRPFAK